MSDILVRDVPDEVVAALDARARRLGLSRNEYLRREIRRIAASDPEAAVSVEDLRRFGDVFADLSDEQVMRDAWR